MTDYCYNKNNTFTIHNEKYEISSDQDHDVNQEVHILYNYNTPDHRNTIQTPQINNKTVFPYSRLIGNEAIQRLNRIQQYNKAFDHCLKQQSGLESWRNKKQKNQPPEAPPCCKQQDSAIPRNSTDTINPIKRLLLLHDHNNLSSFISSRKKHIILKVDVKKKFHRTSQYFIFQSSNVLNRPKRFSENDVLADKVLLA